MKIISGTCKHPKPDALYCVFSSPINGYRVGDVIRGADCNWNYIGIVAHMELPFTMNEADALSFIRTSTWNPPSPTEETAAKPRPELVPGVMRCAKCNLVLHRTNLYVHSGTTGPGDNTTEPCPNGCGPLWPVTWEQWGREAQKTAERLFDEAAAERARADGLAQQVEGLRAALSPFAKAFEATGIHSYTGTASDPSFISMLDQNQVIPSKGLTVGTFRAAWETLTGRAAAVPPPDEPNLPPELAAAGWRPMSDAPRDGTVVKLLLRHPNYKYATGEERYHWESVARANWTDFQDGGWVWRGMYGQPIGWRPAEEQQEASAP